METYQYVYKQPGIIDIGAAIENDYTRSEIAKKFVVRDEKNNQYHVCSNFHTFFEFLDTLPDASKNYHEVIFGFMPQKIKFDIDAAYDAVVSLCPDQDPNITIKNILNNIIDAITSVFYTTYGKDLLPNDYIYCRSTHPDERKYSYHVILNKAVIDNRNADKFTRNVIAVLPMAYHQFLDIGVNTSLQNFRLIDCCKVNSLRKKVLLGTNFTREDTIITNIANCELMPDIVADQDAPAAPTTAALTNSEDVKAALDLAAEVARPFIFRRESAGKLLFDRRRASFCDICKREHTTDNTLVVNMFYCGDVVKVSYSCRHDRSNTKLPLGEFISAVRSRNDSPTVGINGAKYLQKVLSEAPNTMSRTPFDSLPNKNIYNEDKLRPFEFAPTLCVRAAMKMGKTKALIDHLAAYNSALAPPIIRFISFRQTFSHNIKEKFPDFTLYSDVKGPLGHNKLIVQVESLHRLELHEHPDLLILDECESIFEQFDSGLLRNFNASFAAFQWLLKYSKRVICLDAAIGERSYNILLRMRPQFIQTCVYHCNNYQNAINDNYQFTISKSRWLVRLYEAVADGKRVALPISNLVEAKVIAANLRKKFPDRAIKLYSSETSMVERKIHFADVNTYWSQYDVLIYTPTVSAGVSFERAHFDLVYGFFTDMSCPVETCIQMIGRIRDVKLRQYVIYLDGNGNSLPTDVSDITKLIYTSRDNLNRVLDEAVMQGQLMFEYGPNGEVKYYDTDYFHMYVQNMRIKNLSKNNFVKRFIDFIGATGAKVADMATAEAPQARFTGAEIMADHKAERIEIKDAHNAKIANSMELTAEQYAEIKLNMAAGETVSEELIDACSLYQLRSTYNYYNVIDQKFIGTYGRNNVKRWYKNLCRISTCDDMMIALEAIRVEELKNYATIMLAGDEAKQNVDVNRRYVYDQHRLAIMLLRSCGFDNLRDRKFISLWTIMGNLKRQEQNILSELDMIYYHFEFGRKNRLDIAEFNAIKAPITPAGDNHNANAKSYIDALLRPINRVLHVMYGTAVRKAGADVYRLETCELFVYGTANGAANGAVNNTSKPIIPINIINKDEFIQLVARGNDNAPDDNYEIIE